jgi:tRNA U34 5-methylaminomethyl-2-thiouridine-forming methyltransferase MnmC
MEQYRKPNMFFIKWIVFISKQTNFNIEIGFGTGLNAFITFLEGTKMNQSIDYVGVEAYPVSAEELGSMNYVEELNALNHKGVLIKCKVIGEKRESRR